MKTMINERILLLKSQSDLSNLDFCHKAKISHGTLHNIQRGENVSDKTIKALCKNLHINPEWLKTGKGEIHLKPNDSTVTANDNGINPYRDALVKELKEQVEFLKGIVQNLTGGKVPANFKLALIKKDSGKIIALFPELSRATA